MTDDSVDDDVMGIILAGGASRRMGKDKLSLPRAAGSTAGDDTVLAHVIRTVQLVCVNVWVLTNGERPDVHVGRATVHWLADTVPRQGPLKALAATFTAHAHPAAYCVVVAGDLPGLSAQALLTCIETLRSAPEADAALVSRDGRLQPLFGCYRTSRAADAFERAVSAGADRLMDALTELRIITIAAEQRGWPTWWVKPIHTPQDYEAWLCEHASESAGESLTFGGEAKT